MLLAVSPEHLLLAHTNNDNKRRFICTVESCKFEVLGTRSLFRIISSSNNRQVDIKYYQCFFSQSNVSFGCVKETSQGDVIFKHSNQLLK